MTTKDEMLQALIDQNAKLMKELEAMKAQINQQKETEKDSETKPERREKLNELLDEDDSELDFIVNPKAERIDVVEPELVEKKKEEVKKDNKKDKKESKPSMDEVDDSYITEDELVDAEFVEVMDNNTEEDDSTVTIESEPEVKNIPIPTNAKPKRKPLELHPVKVNYGQCPRQDTTPVVYKPKKPLELHPVKVKYGKPKTEVSTTNVKPERKPLELHPVKVNYGNRNISTVNRQPVDNGIEIATTIPLGKITEGMMDKRPMFEDAESIRLTIQSLIPDVVSGKSTVQYELNGIRR